jgi:DNA-binding NarL/FixJ family response regulator
MESPDAEPLNYARGGKTVSEEEKIRLLIVDDIPETRERLRAMALSDGCIEVVGEAADGRKAIHAYKRLRPDVVSMDINMPNMDGITAIQRIREMDPGARIFIVSLQDSHYYMRRAKQAGAFAYIVTPPSQEKYIDTIRKGMGRAGQQKWEMGWGDISGIAGRVEILVAAEESEPIHARLQGVQDLEVVAEVRRGLKALQVYEALRPAVIIFGESLIDMEARDAARLLRLRNPEAKILALVSDACEFQEYHLGRVGVKAVRSTQDSEESLSRSIRELALHRTAEREEGSKRTEDSQRPIRLLVVEDEPSLRHAMCAIWNMTDDIQVVAAAGTGIEGLERYELHLPDVVSTNISMPELDGIEMAGLILFKHPDAKILFITAHQAPGTAERLEAAGAAGYLAKPVTREELVSAVRKVARGERGSRGAREQGGRGAGERRSRGAREQGGRGAREQGSRGAGER